MLMDGDPGGRVDQDHAERVPWPGAPGRGARQYTACLLTTDQKQERDRLCKFKDKVP